jgi:hypothetical protein
MRNTPLGVTVDDIRELVATLNHFCFRAGTDRFKQERDLDALPANFFQITPPDILREFFQCTNWSLKQAQEVIIRWRLDLELANRTGTLEVEEPFTFQFMICLLTDFADTIGWMLLQGDISWVRSMLLEVHPHSDLENHNWRSVEIVLADMNRDPDQIVLATDLTSFMHVGDVFVRNTATGETACFEIKSGTENTKVLDVLSAASPDEFVERLENYVSSAKNPEHAIDQVERNLKQHIRMARSMRYSETGRTERIDLKSDLPVTVRETGAEEVSWSEAVRELADGLVPDDARLAVVDGCLIFEYGRHRHTNWREAFFQYRVSRHLGLSTEPEDYTRLPVFDVGQATAIPGLVPQSTNLWSLGEELQSRLLALDDYLLVYLHVPALKTFLEAGGVSLLIRNARSGDRQLTDRLTRAVLGNNRVAVIERAGHQGVPPLGLSGGLIGRVLFNFMAPRTMLDMFDLR